MSAAYKEKERLIGYVDHYLNALVANDPALLPVTADVRFTENTTVLTLGEGLWKTASAIKYRHCVADPAQGQVGLFSTLYEGGDKLTLFTLY